MRGHLRSGETHVISRTQTGAEREEHVPCRVDKAYWGPEVRGTGVQVGEEGLATERLVRWPGSPGRASFAAEMCRYSQGWQRNFGGTPWSR